MGVSRSFGIIKIRKAVKKHEIICCMELSDGVLWVNEGER
jgi:hypothetical protein